MSRIRSKATHLCLWVRNAHLLEARFRILVCVLQIDPLRHARSEIPCGKSVGKDLSQVTLYSDSNRIDKGVYAIAPRHETGPRPKISVITVCLNAVEPLEETISSVSSQNSGQIEHVVVDGASTDGTPDYLASLGENVKWVSEPDNGIADAMNKGVALATGEWILVLQAGDLFAADDCITSLSPYLDSDADILSCGVLYGQPGSYRKFFFSSPSRRLIFKPISHQGTLCRRHVFEQLGGFDPTFRIAMDYEFLLRARQAGCRFLSAPVMLAKMDDTGVSSQTDWPSLQRRFSEEHRAQRKHNWDGGMRIVYAVYWPLYLAYRRLRSVMAKT